MKEIKIACEGYAVAPLEKFKELQGDLKHLGKKEFKALRSELLEEGFSFPINVWQDGETLWILDGHQRTRVLKNMREEGFQVPDLPYSVTHADSYEDAKIKCLAAASQYGRPTQDGLLDFLSDLTIDPERLKLNFPLTDISMPSIVDSYIRFTETGEMNLNDPDAIPEVKEPISKPGDLFQLGRHRLLCGDATRIDAVDKLMAGDKADMVFTDPPYGVNYDGGHAQKGIRREKLANDDSTQIYDDSVPLMVAFSKDKAALYLWFAATKALQVLQVLQANNYEIRSWIIWNKNMAQFGAIGAQYKQKHEPCLYCFKKGHVPFWDGPTNEVSVWDMARSSKNEYHPTQKPVELAERAMNNSCPKGGLVIDLFGGSGATLIAAEKSQRRANLMEIDPHYCDVIIARYEQYTGQKAVKIDS